MSVNLVVTIEYSHVVVRFKLYQYLAGHHISHNTFMRETETGYHTMKRYARGEINKIEISILDRWCRYLNCGVSDLIEFQTKKPKQTQ